MKSWILIIISIVILVAAAPFLLIARARSRPSSNPRPHVFLDMDHQPKFQAQQPNALFVDGREMRLPVQNTNAVEDMSDAVVASGMLNGQFLTVIPIPVDDALMQRGQERFGVYCSPCHGLSGYGDGMIARRAEELAQTETSSWIPPTSYHTDTVRKRPVGHIFNTISNGIRSMPSYRAQIPINDRWAIVSYVRALQLSQNANIADVPESLRPTLR